MDDKKWKDSFNDLRMTEQKKSRYLMISVGNVKLHSKDICQK